MHEATLALFACDTAPRLAEVGAERAAALLGAEGAYVALFDAEEAAMRVVSGSGPFAGCAGVRINYGFGAAGRAWQTHAALCDDERGDGVPGEEEQGTLAAHLTVPLMSRARVLGVIGVRMATGRPAPTELAARLMRLAEALTLALERARRFEAARLEAQTARAAEATLRRLALLDPLTGLPNRSLFEDRLRQAMHTAERTCEPFTLLFLDLDRFKAVNDTHGHQFGDRLLERAGARLREALRDSDTVARLGGDEFAMLLPAAGAAAALALAQKAIARLSEPFLLDGYRIEIGSSIGIAVYPEHGANAEALVRRADMAMYAAKRRGGGVAVSAPERDEPSSSRVAFAADLRRGLGADLAGARLGDAGEAAPGLPARLRLQPEWHPRLGALPAERFVPPAEHASLSRELTHRLVRAALADPRMHVPGAEQELCAARSPRLLRDPTLPAQLRGLPEREAPPERLCLELPVAAVWPTAAASSAGLAGLRSAGFGLALTGYDPGQVSPDALRALAVDELQLAPDAVAGLIGGRRGRRLLGAATKAVAGPGLRLLAETGNIAEARQLAALGCTVARTGVARISAAHCNESARFLLPP
ncbi:MAG TPA: diguanylate cyclase [Dehalococcoidia bacterium]|nr:diguanylate cyclase [Dehalococcoidia bacterium]